MIADDDLYAMDNDPQLFAERQRRRAAPTPAGPAAADRAMSAGTGALAGGAALAPLGPWAAAGGALVGGLFGALDPKKPDAGKSMGDTGSLVDEFGNPKPV